MVLAAAAVLVAVFLASCGCEGAPGPIKRIRKSAKKVCTDKDQAKMSEEFNECINKFTQIHHENMGRSMSIEDSQKYTCQMLSDTVECGSVWKDCHTAAEVRSIKDSHIAARINQFAGASSSSGSDGGGGSSVDIHQCQVVKEYVESGRAEEVQHTTEGSCTNREVTLVQGAFQSCSHNLSTVAWDKIKDLQDSRRLAALEAMGADGDGETNDILEEEERLDAAGLVGDDELRPMLCSTLMDIGNKCVLSITKCFSREDINLMRDQHMQTMASYYSSLYDNIDLSSCSALTAFSVDTSSSGDDYDDYEPEYYDYGDEEDYTEEDNEEEEQQVAPPTPQQEEFFPLVSETDDSSTTTNADVTTTATQKSPKPTKPSPTAAAVPSEPEHQKRGSPSQLPVSSDDEMPASGASATSATAIIAALSVVLLQFP